MSDQHQRWFAAQRAQRQEELERVAEAERRAKIQSAVPDSDIFNAVLAACVDGAFRAEELPYEHSAIDAQARTELQSFMSPALQHKVALATRRAAASARVDDEENDGDVSNTEQTVKTSSVPQVAKSDPRTEFVKAETVNEMNERILAIERAIAQQTLDQDRERITRAEREAAEARKAHQAACAELAALRRADFLNDRMQHEKAAPEISASAAENKPSRQYPGFVVPLSEELRKAAHFGLAEVNDMFKDQYMALLSEVTDGASGWAVLARTQNNDLQQQFIAAFADARAAASAAAARRAARNDKNEEPIIENATAEAKAATPQAMRRLAVRCTVRSHLHESIKDTLLEVLDDPAIKKLVYSKTMQRFRQRFPEAFASNQ